MELCLQVRITRYACASRSCCYMHALLSNLLFLCCCCCCFFWFKMIITKLLPYAFSRGAPPQSRLFRQRATRLLHARARLHRVFAQVPAGTPLSQAPPSEAAAPAV